MTVYIINMCIYLNKLIEYLYSRLNRPYRVSHHNKIIVQDGQ